MSKKQSFLGDPNYGDGFDFIKELSFEENLKQLQMIVNKLESSDNSLEETMALYKTAADLAEKCNNMLEEAEQEVNTINSGDKKKEL